MRCMIATTLCVSALCLFISPVHAQPDVHPDTDLAVRALTDLSPGEVDWIVQQGRTAALSTNISASALASIRANERAAPGARLVDVLGIRGDLLVSSGPGSRSVNEPPPRADHLTLTIEGVEYTLDVVESIRERRGTMRHVLAAVVTEPTRSYARFTVDEESGAIAGTVSVRRGVYRIVPRAADSQSVFRVDAADSGSISEQSELLARGVASPTLSKVETRHAQVLTLAEVRPWYVKLAENDSLLLIRGGDLGTVDIDNLADPGEVTAVLRRLSALTRWRDGTAIEVTSVPTDFERSGDFAIRYRQIINGIPVNESQEVNFDAAGKVNFVLSSLADPEAVPRPEQLLDEARAFEAAVDAVSRSVIDRAARYERIELPVEPLVYEITGRERRPVAIYSFGIRIVDIEGERSQYVTVDASSGEATLHESGLHAVGEDFRTKVYRTVSGMPQAPGGNTELVWWETNDADIECANEDYCGEEEYFRPVWVIGNLNVEMENNTDSATCCLEIGRDVPGKSYDELDVIVDTNAAGNAQYSPQNQSVQFDPDFEYARSFEVIAHELGHAQQHAYNTTLFPGGNGTPSDPRTRAFLEGAADAFAGAMSEIREAWASGFGMDVGEPWVIGDGDHPLSSAEQRDMRDPVNFDVLDNPTNAYVRSRAFSNYYYRLKTQNVVSVGRLMELILQVNRLIRDTAGDGVDAQDFNTALQAAVRPGETALASAISTVFSQMGGTTPGPGGSPPFSPFGLGGTFVVCSYPYSVYQGGWSPSSGAAIYEIDYLHSSGFWAYDRSWTITSGIYFSTPYSTSWRVRACNANGCSGYSNTWSTPHVCQ